MFTILAAVLFAAIYFTSPPKRYPTKVQTFSYDEFRRRHDLRFTNMRSNDKLNKSEVSQIGKILEFKPRESKSKK